jgi:hypothetical protein
MDHVVRRCYPSGKWSYVRAPARHSFSQLARPPILAISEVRIQKLPLTLRPPLFAAVRAKSWLPNSVFGIVFHNTYRQALFGLGLSWLSFSRSRFSRDTRTWSGSGFGCHQPEGSPRRHTLNEPAFTSRPEPRGRICSLLRPLTDFGT